MGFWDLAEKAAKYVVADIEKDEQIIDQREEKRRQEEELQKERQKKLDTLRNPMRTYMKGGDIGENELSFLKSTAAKSGIDAHEFEMRFNMVRSARDEYNAHQCKKKGLFSSESPDLFFYSENEIEEYFVMEMTKGMGMVLAMSGATGMKVEQKIADEMRRPHFDTAFDEAFASVNLTQDSPVQQQSQQPQMTPPPIPSQVQYTLNINGQNQGPYDMQQLQQLLQNGQLTRQTYVWKQGMANWAVAGDVQELSLLFGAVPPPPPSMP